MTGLQTTLKLTLCVHVKPFKGFSLRQMNEKKTLQISKGINSKPNMSLSEEWFYVSLFSLDKILGKQHILVTAIIIKRRLIRPASVIHV